MTLRDVNSPTDLRQVAIDDLPPIAQEIRELLVDTCSKNAGHSCYEELMQIRPQLYVPLSSSFL
ncbi:MAG: hypothetical protein FJY86_04505 [Candidatus Diapherotrites archaeon]|uniref:Uncharacterized protein n=1 Tax=Candidatus Iainarchaeum sp. TaxID=3101447 RepID=A0A8T4CCB5_9ARCH|nr:hypothetical protein [Candidatus Diapherotrites archaeon]